MTESNTTEKQLLTVAEIANILHVSKTSIYRLIENRLIPFHRLPRGLRFRKEDVEAFLLKRRVGSVDETYERTKT